MKTLLSLLLLVLLVPSTMACPVHHWSARQELEEEGYEEISFGEVPGEEDEHVFFARRGGSVCSGLVDLTGDAPRIDSTCRPLSSSSHH